MESLARRVVDRARLSGVVVAPALAERLSAYIGLLAKWNKTINLTSLELDPPGDEALDRLLIEPLLAEQVVAEGARLAVDVGSGGGSPAIPLKLARPSLRMVLVESKVRKCAFLREAAREFELAGLEVANARFEDAARRQDLQAAADVVTLRAVRVDSDVLAAVEAIVRPGGQVLLFGSRDATPGPLESFLIESEVRVPPSGGSIVVLRRPV